MNPKKQTSMKYLLNVNASLEIIVSDSLVCVEVMYYSIQFSEKKKNKKEEE